MAAPLQNPGFYAGVFIWAQAYKINSDKKQNLQNKKPQPFLIGAFIVRSLTMTYSHMGRPHTTIGAEQFHFRVRKGIGWFPLAIAARQTGFAFA